MTDPVNAAGDWYQTVLVATANALLESGQDPGVAAVVVRKLALQGFTLEPMATQVTHQ